MFIRPHPARILAALILALTAAPAGAVLITSNLAADDGLNFGGYGIHAQRFETGPHAYALDDVVLRVASFPRSSSIAGVEALLWSDDAANHRPGSVITNFVIPPLPENLFAEAVFVPAAPVVLAASTSYWVSLVHTSSTSGGVQWRGAVAGTVASGPGDIPSTHSVSLDGGANWFVNSNEGLKLAVNGSVRTPAVAEPASAGLLLSGALAALARRPRRRPTSRGVSPRDPIL